MTVGTADGTAEGIGLGATVGTMVGAMVGAFVLKAEDHTTLVYWPLNCASSSTAFTVHVPAVADPGTAVLKANALLAQTWFAP